MWSSIWAVGSAIVGLILAIQNTDICGSWSFSLWARRTLLWPFYLGAVIFDFKIGEQ